MGTIDTMEFENLNFSMFEPCFGLVWMELKPECWICTLIYAMVLKGICNGLERTIYVPIVTVLPVYCNKKRSNGLERNPRSSPFAM